jgi:glycine dehydrogenase
MVIKDDFDMPYSRKKAAYPLEWVKSNKYFPPVGKIDDAYGDRNLCTCIPVHAFAEPVVEVDVKEI